MLCFGGLLFSSLLVFAVLLETPPSRAQCNSDPIAVDDRVLHTGDARIIDVLANDIEPDGELLRVAAIVEEDCDFADVTALFDTVRLIPTGRSSENCSITYRVRDESSRTADAIVEVVSSGLLFKDSFETGDLTRWDEEGVE